MNGDDEIIEMNYEDWLEDFCSQLVNETYRNIDQQTRDHSPEIVLEVACAFTSKFIGSVLFRALNLKPEKRMSQAKHAEFTSENFRAAKEAMQLAIEAGFEGAVGGFAGRQVKYTCMVTMDSDTKDKLN